MSSDAKFVRGQLRQIVKELYPHMMTIEQHEQILKFINDRMKSVSDKLDVTLKQMAETQEKKLDYVIRNITKATSIQSK